MANWIEWRPEYRVGVEKIDQQHEGLFGMFNELGDALWDGKGKDVIGKTLRYLAEYAADHFHMEEAYMRSCNYPGYSEHKKVHDELVDEVSRFIAKYNLEELPHSAVLEVVNRIGTWTRDHVRKMDQEMAIFVRGNGKAAL